MLATPARKLNMGSSLEPNIFFPESGPCRPAVQLAKSNHSHSLLAAKSAATMLSLCVACLMRSSAMAPKFARMSA